MQKGRWVVGGSDAEALAGDGVPGRPYASSQGVPRVGTGAGDIDMSIAVIPPATVLALHLHRAP